MPPPHVARSQFRTPRREGRCSDAPEPTVERGGRGMNQERHYLSQRVPNGTVGIDPSDQVPNKNRGLKSMISGPSCDDGIKCGRLNVGNTAEGVLLVFRRTRWFCMKTICDIRSVSVLKTYGPVPDDFFKTFPPFRLTAR